MTYVVTDDCIKCKYTDCVCPVDCFYEGENMLVINPSECIDCACANHAQLVILPDTEDNSKWLELNTKFSAEWPNITQSKEPPADADEHKGEEDKFDKYFSPEPGEGD